MGILQKKLTENNSIWSFMVTDETVKRIGERRRERGREEARKINQKKNNWINMMRTNDVIKKNLKILVNQIWFIIHCNYLAYYYNKENSLFNEI